MRPGSYVLLLYHTSYDIPVLANHLYVDMGRHNSLLHHHANIELLSDDQLTTLLEEQHANEEWVLLLQGLNQCMLDQVSSDYFKVLLDVGMGFHDIVLAAVMPGKKSKQRYEDSSDETLTTMPKKPENPKAKSLFDDDLTILPSLDSEEFMAEEKIEWWGNGI